MPRAQSPFLKPGQVPIHLFPAVLQSGARTPGREGSLPSLTGAPRAGSDRARVPSPRALRRSILGLSKEERGFGALVGQTGPQPPPFHPHFPVPKRRERKLWGRHWIKFGVVPAGARVTQATRTRDHLSQNASPIFLGLCSRFSPPGATQSVVRLWTRSMPGG